MLHTGKEMTTEQKVVRTNEYSKRATHKSSAGYVLWYSNSLVYGDIYVSDAEGVGGRPFTIALPLKKRWIVMSIDNARLDHVKVTLPEYVLLGARM
jgi:hypothetical protein